MTSQEIENILKGKDFHEETINRIIDSYEQIRFYYGMGKYQDVGNHVGNFCENAANLILDILDQGVKPNESLSNILDEIERYNNDPSVDKTVRITIPRFLRATYDMRSQRDTVHVNLEVPVNHADQNAAVNMCTWILAELVRAYGDKEMDETAELIENLASDVSPYVDEYKGKKLLMSNELSVPEEILVHLYNVPGDIDVDQLVEWVHNANSNHVRKSLRDLEDSRKVHYDGDMTKITSPLGAEKAEELIENKIEK